MITDENHPGKPPRDRSNELWLNVNVARAQAAYAKGANDLELALPQIAEAFKKTYGQQPVASSPFSKQQVLQADVSLNKVKSLIWHANNMAYVLYACEGTTSMPESEVRAWLRLEDGTTLNGLLNPK
jgi:purine nucleoside permease